MSTSHRKNRNQQLRPPKFNKLENINFWYIGRQKYLHGTLITAKVFLCARRIKFFFLCCGRCTILIVSIQSPHVFLLFLAITIFNFLLRTWWIFCHHFLLQFLLIRRNYLTIKPFSAHLSTTMYLSTACWPKIAETRRLYHYFHRDPADKLFSVYE